MGKPRPKRRRKSRATMSPERAAAIRDANLKPAEPGEVRNPAGKNGHEWRKMLRDFAAGLSDDDVAKKVKLAGAGDSRFDVLMKAIFRNVVLGREASQKLMFEQLAGRARQHIEIAGAGNGPEVTFMLPENGRDVEVSPAADTGGNDSPTAGDAGAEE